MNLDHGWARDFIGDVMSHRHMSDYQRIFMGVQSHGVFSQAIKVCGYHHHMRGLRQQKRQAGIAATGGCFFQFLFQKIVTVNRVGRELFFVVIAVVTVFVLFINLFNILPLFIFFCKKSSPYFFIPQINQLCSGRDTGGD